MSKVIEDISGRVLRAMQWHTHDVMATNRWDGVRGGMPPDEYEQVADAASVMRAVEHALPPHMSSVLLAYYLRPETNALSAKKDMHIALHAEHIWMACRCIPDKWYTEDVLREVCGLKRRKGTGVWVERLGVSRRTLTRWRRERVLPESNEVKETALRRLDNTLNLCGGLLRPLAGLGHQQQSG